MTFQKLGAQFKFLYKAEASRLCNVTFEFHVFLTLTKELILLITDLTISIRHIRTLVIHTSKDLTKHVLKPHCLPWQILLPHYRGPKLTFSFDVNAITSHQYQQEGFTGRSTPLGRNTLYYPKTALPTQFCSVLAVK